MTLAELLEKYPREPAGGVPDWMLGCFRRRCISFANGQSDEQTIVYWFQSRNFTIDLRLPRLEDQVRAAPLNEYNELEIVGRAGYEGWLASCAWSGEAMVWHPGDSLQVTDRWPEPAQLKRIGNCMIEFAPSGAYVEDWRLQPSAPGPLLGLQLLQEYDENSGQWSPRGGGLIICGDHAAQVLGRSAGVTAGAATLQELAANAVGDTKTLRALLDFETSVAAGSVADGYTVVHSTIPERRGQPLLEPGEFSWVQGSDELEHEFYHNGRRCLRRYAVDVIESQRSFSIKTPANQASENWFARESATLRRYAEVLV
ncbi:MAG: hypothetical protein NXH81_01500 [Halieaceae bacterium]|jgi:hypothetical protein|uniref:hypothetical protein n=1 Tax=Haliea alexandrii TaxID=2448162 RepID=UPI000F0B5C8E|nr:hypothetical protein [Haliea alexandrii]MCR9184051.1 hypothetical protein [Halieaceae bacterium]